jgi:hypothetical protein
VARHQFEAYLDEVFGSSDLVSPLPEGRLFSQHSWKQVFLCVMHLVSISVAKFRENGLDVGQVGSARST